MKAIEVAKIIEEFAPLAIQESWDNSGFSVGNKNVEVKSILLGLDCTQELIEEALECGANMIITHHPLIFGGLTEISNDTEQGKAIMAAIKNDVVVYSCHTNIDKVLNGVSGTMSKRLSLENVSILDVDSSGFGLGVVGNFRNPIAPDDFISLLKNAFSLEFLRSSELPQKNIYKVALCGGSGKSLMAKAIECGADALVTGDITYHDFFCPKDFLLVDIGHFESEIDILQTIFDILTKKIHTFAVHISNKKYNPVYYY